MGISISMPGGFGAALEQNSLPLDSSLPADELSRVLYVQQPELEPQLPMPVPVPEADALASAEPQQARELEVAEPVLDPALESVDPQQWLSMMLSQQAIRLQARDDAGKTPSGVPGERLLARMAPEPRDPAPVLESRRVFEAPLPVQSGPDAEFEHPGTGVGPRLPVPAAPAVSTGENPWVAATATATATATAVVAGSVEPLSSTEVSAPTTSLPGSSTTAEPVLERGLKLAAPQARWGEQMLHALRETVEVQVQQRFQQATIRLDPPELGSLEIFISHENGRLSVHISAAQTDVARLIATTSERLRQELVEQNTLQVQVQVSSDSQGHSQREQGRSAREPSIADAMAEAEGSAVSPKRQDSGVLVTV